MQDALRVNAASPLERDRCPEVDNGSGRSRVVDIRVIPVVLVVHMTSGFSLPARVPLAVEELQPLPGMQILRRHRRLEAGDIVDMSFEVDSANRRMEGRCCCCVERSRRRRREHPAHETIGVCAGHRILQLLPQLPAKLLLTMKEAEPGREAGPPAAGGFRQGLRPVHQALRVHDKQRGRLSRQQPASLCIRYQRHRLKSTLISSVALSAETLEAPQTQAHRALLGRSREVPVHQPVRAEAADLL
mmetsp:Transcript_16633/g.31465  ORF Transcript_16633/g.31465 Transcript_16633/m.31465 type:complete len:245 (+) Transcript_16633:385-1119(+)